MTTGLHKDAYSHPLTTEATIDKLASSFIKEVVKGVGETGIKAGVVKAATSLNAITPGEEKVLRAAALTHLATGVQEIGQPGWLSRSLFHEYWKFRDLNDTTYCVMTRVRDERALIPAPIFHRPVPPADVDGSVLW